METLESRTYLSAAPLLVKDIFAGADSSRPYEYTAVGPRVFFTATTNNNRFQLYVTDGSAANTIQLTDINDPLGLDAFALTAFNGKLYFDGSDTTHGNELWVSDGTPSGTRMLKDIYPGVGSFSANSSNARSLTVYKNQLFFVADDGVHGDQLYKSDGTSAGTKRIGNFNPGGLTAFNNLTVVGNTLYFAGDDGIHGPGIYKSDGTAVGTSFVKSTGMQSGTALPIHLVAAGNLLFYNAFDPDLGWQLYKSDGTAAGTGIVKAVSANTGSDLRGFDALVPIVNTVYFNADDGVHGLELYKSDGTADGTVMVKDLYPGSFGGNPKGLTAFKGQVYFAASDSLHGVELMHSDGSAAGTDIVADLAPDLASSSPFAMTGVGDTLYFGAYDDYSRGKELWITDGTAGGTALVAELNAGSNDALDDYSYHEMLATDGGALYFTADDGVHGFELWQIGAQPGPPLKAGISGTVFNDANANARRDAGEAGLARQKVYLDLNNNKKREASEPQVTTNSAGAYSFTNLTPGNYKVRVVVPANKRLSTPRSGLFSVVAVAGDVKGDLAFGLAPAARSRPTAAFAQELPKHRSLDLFDRAAGEVL